MATKKIEGRMETIDGPLEMKVDSMLERLSVLETLKQMVQRWEDAERITTSEQKKEKSIILEGSKSGGFRNY